MFDTDAAAIDAADYTLQKAERSLLATLAAERADAEGTARAVPGCRRPRTLIPNRPIRLA